MSYKRRNRVAALPRVPLSTQPRSPQDEFWLQQGSSGAMNAFRQLSSTLHHGGRRTVALPGGKLQPIYKNHTAPPRLEGKRGKVPGPPAVLPGIGQSAGTEVESSRQHILAGNLDGLPPCSPTTVKVYLASNYDDMKLERNMLMKQAVPALQEFCSQHGLYFQLVDLQWGVEVDSVSQVLAKGRELRAQEISCCQRHSVGPQFVALLGDRYGVQPVPSEIPAEDFDVLSSVVRENELQNAAVLEDSYCRDDNAVPPVYVRKIKGVHDGLSELQVLIQEAVAAAKESGKMSAKLAEKYQMSVLEQDLTSGIFETKDPRSHSLCYRREFQNLSKHMDSPEAATYADTVQRGGATVLNEDVQTRNQQMAEKVMQHLGIGNCHQYFLHWDEAGMGPALQAEVESYLQKLCDDFVTDVKQLIVADLKKPGQREDDAVIQEVLHNSHYLARRVEHFCGQSALLGKVEDFLRDPKRNSRPLVIHGLSGSGKTSTMAAIAKHIKQWFTSDCVLVLRFLATTSDSSSIFSTVVSVTIQICQAYGLPLPDQHTHFGTLFQALSTFRMTIESVAEKDAYVRPLFILLDGIDQLQPHDESLRALWAIKDLPLNVHILVSTVPMIGSVNMLGAMVTLVTQEDAAFEVEPLNETDAMQVVNTSLEANSRKVTEAQREVLLEVLNKVRDPLVVRFMAQEANRWHSYDDAVLAESYWRVWEDASKIMAPKLGQLETEYGENLVMMLASYLSASPIGIHERELTELLTCNKDVMEEVHGSYMPPPDGVFHFPPRLLAEMKHQLQGFLEEHYAQGHAVLAWDHRIFYSSITEKYQVIFPGIEEEMITEDATSFTLMLHEHFANMFLNECKTEVLGSSVSLDGFKTLELPQPVCALNLIKLHRLPNHLKVLLPVEGFKRVKEYMLFNYTWLLTKIKALSVGAVIQDVWSIYSLSRHLQEEGVFDGGAEAWQDLEILFEFLQLAQPALNCSYTYLPVEILTRLQPLADAHSSINNLVTTVKAQLESSGEPYMLLTHPSLPAPCGVLRLTMLGPTHIVGFLQEGRVAVMFSQETGVDIWKVETGELLHRFPVSKEQSVKGVIPGNSAEFVIIGHYSHLNHIMDLCVWSSETGIPLVQSAFSQKFEAITLDCLDKVMMVATTTEAENSTPVHTEVQRCLLAVDVRSKEVMYTIAAVGVHPDGVSQMVFVKGIRKGLNGLISVGSRMSKDLAYWDLESEELDYKLDLKCYADHFKVHEDKKMAVCGSSEDGHVIVVDLLLGKISHHIEDAKYVDLADVHITWAGKHLLLATKSSGVIVYSISKGTEVKTLHTPQDGQTLGSPSRIMMDSGENFLFVGQDSGAISVYVTGTGEHVVTLDKHTARINTLCLQKNVQLFSAAQDDCVHIWNIKDMLSKAIQSFDQDEINKWDGVYQFDTDGSAAREQQQQQDGEEGGEEKEEKEEEEHEEEKPVEKCFPSKRYDVSCLVLGPDGKTVITASPAGPVRIWDIVTGEEVATIEEGCEEGVSDLYLAYKGKLLIGHAVVPGVKHAFALKVWNLDRRQLMTFEGVAQVLVFCSAVFPDTEDRLLTISPCANEGESGIIVALYDLFGMSCMTSLHCNIYGSMDRTNLKLLGFTTCPASTSPTIDSESTTGEADAADDAPQNLYAILDYFPSLDVSFFFTFVIGGADCDTISMDHHQPMHLDTYSPSCTVLLKDQAMCMTGTVDGSLVQWDVTTQKIKANFYDREMVKVIADGKMKSANLCGKPAHNGPVTCMALSTDGAVLATGGADGNVKLWDPSGRKLINIIPAHKEKVLCVQLSADNKTLVTGSQEKTVSLLDAHSGKLITCFFAHGEAEQVAMTTDKSYVVAMVTPMEGGSRKLMMLKTVNI